MGASAIAGQKYGEVSKEDGRGEMELRVSIAEAGGTEATNVDRMMSYAARELGLQLSGTSCSEGWSSYSARLSGEAESVRHLITLVESAYPKADIRVEPV